MSTTGTEFDDNGVALPDDEFQGWLSAYSENELPYVESHITHPGGVVHLVGAGPGSANLITLLGRSLLEQADAIVHDAHVEPALLVRRNPSRPAAELHVTGTGEESLDADEAGELLVRLAREGKLVVRLVPGDPLAFGRSTLEAQVLAEADVPFTVVPGVPLPIAAAGRAGIPLTSAGLANTVTVVDETVSGGAPADMKALAGVGGTIVLYGAAGRLRERLHGLLDAGLPDEMPATALSGKLLAQDVITATVGSLPEKLPEAGLERMTVVIGWTNVLRDEIAWSANLPLVSQTVLLSGAELVPGLAERLQAVGATVLRVPQSRIVPIETSAESDAIERLHEFEWLVFNSPHAVERFWVRMRERSLDSRALAHLTVVAAGTVTAAALLRIGIAADVATEFAGADALMEMLQQREEVVGAQVLLAGAQGITGDLAGRLETLGVLVEELPLYRVAPPDASAARGLIAKLDAGEIDQLVFTSPQSVVTYAALLGVERLVRVPTVVADPETGAAVNAVSPTPAREADTPDAHGIAAALVAGME
ncbi:MAG TPA: bifunctional uroporphyrinogen-III C-methyltransferase/uroporphyrinogen-III synthase [Gemmatimonadales bacterium]|nr:bifunctional uroporphyrinogen-III C-methyltransferase/uroporphyrinogen-III synthase [Gemmatimonadales bacterium]